MLSNFQVSLPVDESSNIIDRCPEILRPKVDDEMRAQGLVDEDEALGYIFCTRAFQTSQAICILNDHNSQTAEDLLKPTRTLVLFLQMQNILTISDNTNIRILRFTMS